MTNIDTTHTKEDESLQETAEILSIPGALESIEAAKKEALEGKVIPLENFPLLLFGLLFLHQDKNTLRFPCLILF